MTFHSNTDTRRCLPPVRRASLLDLLALYRQRRALANLDQDALKDLGLSRDRAEAESQRPIWDIPQGWHG